MRFLPRFVTFGLIVFVLIVHVRSIGKVAAIAPLIVIVVIAAMTVAIIAIGNRRRRLQELWKELQPLEDFSSPPEGPGSGRLLSGRPVLLQP